MSIERKEGGISKGCYKNKPIQIVKLISSKKNESRPAAGTEDVNRT